MPAQAIGIGQTCDPANDQCDSPLECDPELKLCTMVVESTRLNESGADWEIPDLQITIPAMELTEPRPCPWPNEDKMCVPWIGQYIAGVYKYAIGIVGILATVVMMFGGVMWIVAGGNASRVSEAKAWIGASLTGLILALTSYMILYQINPKLTHFEPIKVAEVESTPESSAPSDPTGCCTVNIQGTGAYTACVITENSKCVPGNTLGLGLGGNHKEEHIYFKIGGTCHNYASTKYNPCETFEFGCCLYNWDSPHYKDCDNNITFDDCNKKSGLHPWHKGKTCKHLDMWPYNNWVCE